ncbi:hypothetical protein CP10881SC42_0538 [Chlamydia avium]|uniref:Uncharacterized protein n=1 Tax=Chlamydia avium TaxID=1457141 RepID=A0ABP2X6J6_9CHLA|nr:hypothetical protein CP10743SC13_0453 [Chlamydia psittaci 10_743_SC13]EPP38449.1 hypothetical protein CP10881SC42_0538 [Chlamydia avium]
MKDKSLLKNKRFCSYFYYGEVLAHFSMICFTNSPYFSWILKY